MIAVQILEANDVINPEDWCRPLVLKTMGGGSSDFMSFKSCYGGTPENNAQWAKVKEVFGECWYGSKVHELNENILQTEFMRGDPPKSHQLNMSGYTSLSAFFEAAKR